MAASLTGEKPRINLPGSGSPRLRRFAQVAVVGAALFAGVSIALKVPVLAPFPGTTGDPLMRTFGYTAVFAVILTSFKVGVVRVWGNWIERRTERNRAVVLRHAFSREIRLTAIIGGVLAAVYAVLFISLVPVLAPSALAAARACVVLTLVAVEITFRVLPRGGLRFYLRLGWSLLITLAGAGLVIFANGFDLFPEGGGVHLWVFVGLLTVGNLSLAFAEYAELHGVQKHEVSAPMYTLARFIYYTITCIAATVVWGIVKGGWGVLWGTTLMCLDRWYYLVPLAVLAGLADLVRICVKTVVSATYMYVVGSLAVATDVIVQTIAKWIAPETYDKVPGGWAFPLLALGGGLVISLGALAYPHRADKKPTLDTALLASATLPK